MSQCHHIYHYVVQHSITFKGINCISYSLNATVYTPTQFQMYTMIQRWPSSSELLLVPDFLFSKTVSALSASTGLQSLSSLPSLPFLQSLSSLPAGPAGARSEGKSTKSRFISNNEVRHDCQYNTQQTNCRLIHSWKVYRKHPAATNSYLLLHPEFAMIANTSKPVVTNPIILSLVVTVSHVQNLDKINYMNSDV